MAGPTKVIARSARLITVVPALAELLAGFVSGVSELAVAVLVITVPSAVLALTWRVNVKPNVAPLARLGVLQLIVAVKTQLKITGFPVSMPTVTKLRFTGTGSARTTFCAGPGPLLVITTW